MPCGDDPWDVGLTQSPCLLSLGAVATENDALVGSVTGALVCQGFFDRQIGTFEHSLRSDPLPDDEGEESGLRWFRLRLYPPRASFERDGTSVLLHDEGGQQNPARHRQCSTLSSASSCHLGADAVPLQVSGAALDSWLRTVPMPEFRSRNVRQSSLRMSPRYVVRPSVSTSWRFPACGACRKAIGDGALAVHMLYPMAGWTVQLTVHLGCVPRRLRACEITVPDSSSAESIYSRLALKSVPSPWTLHRLFLAPHIRQVWTSPFDIPGPGTLVPLFLFGQQLQAGCQLFYLPFQIRGVPVLHHQNGDCYLYDDSSLPDLHQMGLPYRNSMNFHDKVNMAVMPGETVHGTVEEVEGGLKWLKVWKQVAEVDESVHSARERLLIDSASASSEEDRASADAAAMARWLEDGGSLELTPVEVSQPLAADDEEVEPEADLRQQEEDARHELLEAIGLAHGDLEEHDVIELTDLLLQLSIEEIGLLAREIVETRAEPATSAEAFELLNSTLARSSAGAWPPAARRDPWLERG